MANPGLACKVAVPDGGQSTPVWVITGRGGVKSEMGMVTVEGTLQYALSQFIASRLSVTKGPESQVTQILSLPWPVKGTGMPLWSSTVH